jgi:hypothetical protein
VSGRVQLSPSGSAGDEVDLNCGIRGGQAGQSGVDRNGPVVETIKVGTYSVGRRELPLGSDQAVKRWA